MEKDPPGKALDLRLVCESDVIGMLVGGGGGQSRHGDMMNGRDSEGVAQVRTLGRYQELTYQVTLLFESLASKRHPVAHEDCPSKD